MLSNTDEENLRNKYPNLLSHKNLSGIFIGPGWVSLVDDLCNNIQTYINKKNATQVHVTYIKEKFGSLR